jgi:hypothetical protein
VLLEDAELVKLLLKHGAIPTAADKSVPSALSFALDRQATSAHYKSNPEQDPEVMKWDAGRRSRLQDIVRLLHKHSGIQKCEIPFCSGAASLAPTSVSECRGALGNEAETRVIVSNVLDNNESFARKGRKVDFSLPPPDKLPLLHEQASKEFDVYERSNSLEVNEAGVLLLPCITLSNWLLLPIEKKSVCCRFQNSRGGCRNRFRKCTYVHIQQPWGSVLESFWAQCDKTIPMPISTYNENVAVTSRDLNGKVWFTARYSSVRPMHFYSVSRFDQQLFFAEGGSSGRCSHQNIYWYPSERDALDALATVVIVSHWAADRMIDPPVGLMGPWDVYVKDSRDEKSVSCVQSPESHYGPSSSSVSDSSRYGPPSRPMRERELSLRPTAKRFRLASPTKDVEQRSILCTPNRGKSCFLRPGELICCRITGSCTLGHKCKDLHVRRPLKSVRELNVEGIRKDPFYSSRSYLDKLRRHVENDSNGKLWYTVAYVNEATRVFVLPNGGKGQCNSRGVWWYSTEREAYNAIDRTVGHHRALSGGEL